MIVSIIDPNDVDALNNNGYVLYKLAKINEAIEMATKAISIDNEYANAWYNRAVYYANEKQNR